MNEYQKDLLTKRYRQVRRREPLEDQIQAAVIAHVKYLPDRPNVICIHVPNGGYRHKTTGARLKAMGVRPGVADLEFHWSAGCIFDEHIKRELPAAHVLYLELKTRTGKQSEAQTEFQREAELAGAMYRIAYDLDEALEVLKGYGILK
jgi:hypothetical protein